MGKITTVDGIESFAIGKTGEVDFAPVFGSNNFEVLLIINNRPRRMAICENKSDAENITKGLRLLLREEL